MSAWFMQNLGTIVISFLLAAVVCSVIVKMVRDKKNGRSSCGCNCGNCSAGCCRKQRS
ncbi:MAG: FeoB-associated Cys-rich membrane protein [Blautia sp.]|nr:FeoB-associated Cys-rich membrane protein [Blautia sp.]